MSRSNARIGLSLLPLGNLGGTGVYTEQLLRVLETKGASSGVELVPIVPKGRARPLDRSQEIRNASAARIRWPFRMGSSWIVGDLFAGLDAVHYPTGVGPPISNPPLLGTLHDVSPFLYPETMPYKRAVYLRRMFSNLAAVSRRILADTEWQAQRIREVFPQWADKVRVVYPVIDPIYFREPGNDLLPEVARGNAYLLVVGTLEPRKKLVSLLESWSRSEFNADLILVGAWGWKTGSIERTLAGFGSRDTSQPGLESWRLPDGRSVHRLNFIEKEVLSALYRNAFVLISGSRFEGFGLPVAEAMAVGCPVATPQDSAMAEVAGKAAWFFDPDDPDSLGSLLRAVATQDSDRRSRIECGKARAKTFSDDPFLERLASAYLQSV